MVRIGPFTDIHVGTHVVNLIFRDSKGNASTFTCNIEVRHEEKEKEEEDEPEDDQSIQNTQTQQQTAQNTNQQQTAQQTTKSPMEDEDEEEELDLIFENAERLINVKGDQDSVIGLKDYILAGESLVGVTAIGLQKFSRINVAQMTLSINGRKHAVPGGLYTVSLIVLKANGSVVTREFQLDIEGDEEDISSLFESMGRDEDEKDDRKHDHKDDDDRGHKKDGRDDNSEEKSDKEKDDSENEDSDEDKKDEEDDEDDEDSEGEKDSDDEERGSDDEGSDRDSEEDYDEDFDLEEEIENIKGVADQIDPEDLEDILRQQRVPDSVKQEYFNQVLSLKHDAMKAEMLAEQQAQARSEPPPLRLATPNVESTGDISFIFNSNMLGMQFLRSLDVELQSKGQVSELFADEEGPVGDGYRRRFRRRLNADTMNFDLSQVMAFELRRGDEDSARIEDLNFTVNVPKIDGDELKMKFEFEHPEKVSIGSIPDAIIAEVINADFFSQADGT